MASEGSGSTASARLFAALLQAWTTASCARSSIITPSCAWMLSQARTPVRSTARPSPRPSLSLVSRLLPRRPRASLRQPGRLRTHTTLGRLLVQADASLVRPGARRTAATRHPQRQLVVWSTWRPRLHAHLSLRPRRSRPDVLRRGAVATTRTMRWRMSRRLTPRTPRLLLHHCHRQGTSTASCAQPALRQRRRRRRRRRKRRRLLFSWR